MGSCCTKFDDTTNLVNKNNKEQVNDSVCCKIGPHGDKVTVTSDSNSNYTVTGHGILLGSCALECDTAYWEVKICQIDNPNDIQIGIQRYDQKSPCPLTGKLIANSGDNNSNSGGNSGNNNGNSTWIFNNNNYQLKTDDVISIYWDQTDLPMLNFAINGVIQYDNNVNRIRPSNNVFPAVSVENNSSCQLIFEERNFHHKPVSSKFPMIVCATSII